MYGNWCDILLSDILTDWYVLMTKVTQYKGVYIATDYLCLVMRKQCHQSLLIAFLTTLHIASCDDIIYIYTLGKNVSNPHLLKNQITFLSFTQDIHTTLEHSCLLEPTTKNSTVLYKVRHQL